MSINCLWAPKSKKCLWNGEAGEKFELCASSYFGFCINNDAIIDIFPFSFGSWSSVIHIKIGFAGRCVCKWGLNAQYMYLIQLQWISGDIFNAGVSEEKRKILRTNRIVFIGWSNAANIRGRLSRKIFPSKRYIFWWRKRKKKQIFLCRVRVLWEIFECIPCFTEVDCVQAQKSLLSSSVNCHRSEKYLYIPAKIYFTNKIKTPTEKKSQN